MRISLLFVVCLLIPCVLLGQTQPSRERKTQPAQSKPTGQTQQSARAKETYNSAPNTTNGSDQANESRPNPHDWIDKLNALSTLVIALFTLGLFLSVGYQVSNMRDVERAWVVMDKVETKAFSIAFVGRLPVATTYTIKNAGRTPARILNSCFRFELFESKKGIPPIPEYKGVASDYPSDGLVLVPHGTVTATIEVAAPDGTNEIDPSTANQVKNGQLQAVMYGFVAYQDAFNRKHLWKFCWVYQTRNGTFQLAGPKAYHQHT